MKMLAIRFKIMDEDGKGGISPEEFQNVRPKEYSFTSESTYR
jgi:hypothetical protein